MSISTIELKKAIDSLEQAISLYQKSSEDSVEAKAFRDACIQRFEYTLELSWKVSMKLLGSSTMAAKPAIREMARNNLINNPEVWIEFIDSRNKTSHSYDENTAKAVYKDIELFFPEAKQLFTKLEKL